MRSLLLVSFLAGCSTKAVTSGGNVDTGSGDTASGDETGDTVADTDTGGADSDTDTGSADTDTAGDTGTTDTDTGTTDTDTDTGGTDTDTGTPWDGDLSAYDGDYNGSFSVVAGAYGMTDTCSGPAQFLVASGEITGTASCSFAAGGIAYTLGLTGTYPGDISGTIISDTDVSGTISVDLGGGFSTDWTGAFTGPTLSAAFSGTVSYSGLSLDYNGSFDGTPG